MKKILIVSDYLDKIGGIETYIANLKNIIQDEYEIEYFGLQKVNKFKKIFYLIFSFFNFIFALKFQKKIEDYKPDIIWFHSVSRVLGSSVIKKAKDFDGIKIMTYHDLGYFGLFANEITDEKDVVNRFTFGEFLKKSSLGKFLFPYAIFKYLKLRNIRNTLSEIIDFHTVPSEFMRKYVIDCGYGSENNVEVLPNFITKKQVGKRHDIFQDKINFIFFGRLETSKGFGLLLYFLSDVWNLKFKNKTKYKNILNSIRIFVFGDGSKKNILLDSFDGEDMYGQDIGIIRDLQDSQKPLDCIDSEKGKILYYFGKRDFDTIKEFLSFSHYELVPSLFLETFGLSAVEGAANGVVLIGFDKENIKNFLLDDYTISNSNNAEEFSKKMFNIIENFDLQTRSLDSEKNKKLVQKFII